MSIANHLSGSQCPPVYHLWMHVLRQQVTLLVLRWIVDAVVAAPAAALTTNVPYCESIPSMGLDANVHAPWRFVWEQVRPNIFGLFMHVVVSSTKKGQQGRPGLAEIRTMEPSVRRQNYILARALLYLSVCLLVHAHPSACPLCPAVAGLSRESCQVNWLSDKDIGCTITWLCYQLFGEMMDEAQHRATAPRLRHRPRSNSGPGPVITTEWFYAGLMLNEIQAQIANRHVGFRLRIRIARYLTLPIAVK